MSDCCRESSGDDVKLSTLNQPPLYEQIHDYEVVTHAHGNMPAITQQPLPPQPSGDYTLTTCSAYAPNTATAQSSKGAKADGEYDVPQGGVSGAAKSNEGQYENV